MQDDLNQKEGFHRNTAKTADVENLHQISKNLLRLSHGGYTCSQKQIFIQQIGPAVGPMKY